MSEASAPRTLVCAALVNLNADGKHGAWPPPEKALAGLEEHANTRVEFVSAASAQALEAQLNARRDDDDKPRALLWIPGVSGAEARETLSKFPSIRWLHSFSAGVDGLAPHLQDLEPGGLATTNGRGAFSDSLAEYALAASLHFNKKFARCAANAKQRRWDPFVMPVLRGKTMGLVGYGHIAKATARLARAFGMRVVAVRRTASSSSSSSSQDDDAPDATYAPADRLRLFETADVVVCSLPGTGETLDFCGAAEFAAMRPSAVFVSLGRGAAVDEAALCDALDRGVIGGAALDVFKKEPLPTDSPLWRFGPDKLILTAHNADLTEDYFLLGWQVWRDNLDAMLRVVDVEGGFDVDAASEPFPAAVDWATPFDPRRGY